MDEALAKKLRTWLVTLARALRLGPGIEGIDAEDLAQETFARLLRYSRGRDEAELKRIGRQIMANLVRNISRRRRVAEKILRECPPGMLASPEGGQANDLSGADAIELHERVVAQLKGQAREYFDLALKLGRLDLTATDLMRERGTTRANADQIRSRALRAYVAEIVRLGIEPPPRARTRRRRPGR